MRGFKLIMILLILTSSKLLFGQSTEVIDLVEKGVALHDAGKYKEAIEVYKQALLLDPKSALVHYELAYSYHADKNYTQALTHSTSAMEYDNGKINLQAAIVKGSILDDMGKTQQSVDFYKKLIKQYPQEYLVYYNYAVSLVRLGSYPEAEVALENALINNFGHPSSHLKLAYLKLERGEKVGAAFGLYFFLLLENNSPRATEALTKLEALVLQSKEAGKGKDAPRNINIYIPSSSDTKMGAAAIGLAAVSMIDTELADSVSQDQRFQQVTKRLFSLMGELKENDSKPKKKDKTKQNKADLLWDEYVPFFYALSKTENMEAFSYYLQRASNRPEVIQWLEANPDKKEYLVLWVNSH